LDTTFNMNRDLSSGESPPLATVQRVLRATTEFIAHELARPHAAAPDWCDLEWRIARAVVTIHGVSGLLAAGTRWPGAPGWDAFLMQQRAQISARQPRIRALLQEIHAAARAHGVPLVALKGAALHAQGVYAAGERPMADVDLLVAEADAPRAAELLGSLGFRLGPVTWKHQQFEPEGAPETTTTLGENSADPIKVELHACIREILPLRPVDVTALVWPAAPAPGINDYRSRTGLLLHILLHASGALLGRTARLLHLHDIARLTQPMRPADWDQFFTQGAASADPQLWWAYPPLALADRYFGCVPQAVLERLASGCHWRLRRIYQRCALADVSLSYLWVSAFPGIEWSRSLGEMASYAVQRVRPSPETIALRKAFAASQPLVSGGAWAHTSQARRIVHWLRARQPRQESLQPVRASLALPLA